MSNALLTTATMSCPVCERPVEPTADSTWIVAWYGCPGCGHEWSARIRNGRPDTSSTSDVPIHSEPPRGNHMRPSQVHAGSIGDRIPKRIYWHRELPPLNAEVIGEHVMEATSNRVPGSIARRDELWDRAYAELMENAEIRMTQEVRRLGGRFAHVLDESIDTRHDDATGEAWLHGRFTYVLHR